MVRYKQGETPPLNAAEQTEIKVLAQRSDSEIDCSDIPELDDGFLQRSALWKDVARSNLPWLLAQNASHEAWRKELGRRMVESGNRMETDAEYRRKIQSMTR